MTNSSTSGEKRSRTTRKMRSPSSCRTAGACPCSYREDRKSTRLNSSHLVISYAVFCLKKKKNIHINVSIAARAADRDRKHQLNQPKNRSGYDSPLAERDDAVTSSMEGAPHNYARLCQT